MATLVTQPSIEHTTISVIILCYNAFGALDHLLDTLPLQKADVEYIVVDNGSEAIWPGREWVRTVRVDPNRGIPGGFNAGIAVAQGDWIVLLACDTECTSPGFPENMVLPGQVVTGPSLRANPGGLPVMYIDGWCSAFPRALLDEIGPLDEFYIYCWDDVDLSLRAQNAGYALVQVDCGIVNPTPPRFESIPEYYGRNLEYLKGKFGL